MQTIDLSSIKVDNESSITNNDKQQIIAPENKKLPTTSPDIVPHIENITHFNPIERRRNILLLQMYENEFAEKLKAFRGTNYEKLSDNELISLKNEYDYVIGAKSNVKVAQNVFIKGVHILEHVCKHYTPINVNGLSNLLSNDDELQEDIKHMALKYMNLVKTEPEQRVAYKIITSMILLNQINSASNSGIEITQQNKIPSNSNPDTKIDISKIEQINTNFNDL